MSAQVLTSPFKLVEEETNFIWVDGCAQKRDVFPVTYIVTLYILV